MHEVNITELRHHLPSYLEQVNSGEEIWVTSRGKIIARLIPPLDVKAAALEQLKLLRNACKIGDVISPIGEDWDANNDNS